MRRMHSRELDGACMQAVQVRVSELDADIAEALRGEEPLRDPGKQRRQCRVGDEHDEQQCGQRRRHGAQVWPLGVLAGFGRGWRGHPASL